MSKSNFVITAPATMVFGGSRRNGRPVVLPITRSDVARQLLSARRNGWAVKKITNGYAMQDTGITYTTFGVAA